MLTHLGLKIIYIFASGGYINSEKHIVNYSIRYDPACRENTITHLNDFMYKFPTIELKLALAMTAVRYVAYHLYIGAMLTVSISHPFKLINLALSTIPANITYPGR